METRPNELQKYNLFSQFKKSNSSGWVLYFGSEDDRDELYFNLKKMGIDSERRLGRTGFMYFNWLIVGTPSYLVDDLVGALRKYECYFNQDESEWHPYNILIKDSEPAKTIRDNEPTKTISDSEPAKNSKPWWKFWN